VIIRGDFGTEKGNIETMQNVLPHHGTDALSGRRFVYGSSTHWGASAQSFR